MHESIEEKKSGSVTGAVKWTLRAEGLAMLIAALSFYVHFEFSWIVFAALFLVPDLSFFGYLINNKFGAIAYNCAHSLIGAIIVVGLGFLSEMLVLQIPGLVWVAHIGFDRPLGYGLKYQMGFGFTHLGQIGKTNNIQKINMHEKSLGSRQ